MIGTTLAPNMEEHCSVEVSQARCCLPFAGAEEAGMKGSREHAADVFTEKG